jgi:hypothetical protein
MKTSCRRLLEIVRAFDPTPSKARKGYHDMLVAALSGHAWPHSSEKTFAATTPLLIEFWCTLQLAV